MRPARASMEPGTSAARCGEEWAASQRDVMRALTVNPGQPHSLSLDEMPPPPESDGAVLVRAMALGVCGTDREIIEGLYGSAPDGAERLIIGHESLGQVEEAPAE